MITFPVIYIDCTYKAYVMEITKPDCAKQG